MAAFPFGGCWAAEIAKVLARERGMSLKVEWSSMTVAVDPVSLERSGGTASRPFFPRVESLRGLGALAVAGYHLTGFEWIPGRSALMMFFVISGFVLCVSLRHGPQDVAPAAARFIIARIFRIWPIVVFSVLFVTLIVACLPGSSPALQLNFRTFFLNAALLDVGLNGALWALQVEVLAVPVILGLYFVERRYGSRYLLLFALVSTLLSFSGAWALWPPLSHNLFAISLGMLIPIIGRGSVAQMSSRQAQLSAIAAILGLLLPGPLLGFYSQWSGVTAAGAAAALVSLLVNRRDLPWAAFLEWTTTRRLGLVSGSYYVLHMPIAMAVDRLFALSGFKMDALLFVPVVLLSTFLIALLTYSLIEKPGIALGRDLTKQLRLQPSRP
ncbi:MAG: acyltransferase [Tepidamorphaceae bacterium]